MVFGLTEDGFTPKTLNDVKTEQELALQGAFGQNINLEPSSVFGQLVGIYSEMKSDLWAAVLAAYFSQYPDFASGVALDRICAINNIQRKAATSTQTNALVKGTDGTTIPANSSATDTATGRVYRSASEVELSKDAATTARVVVASVASGDYTITINASAYTFTADGSSTEAQILTGLRDLVTAIVGITAVVSEEGIEISADTLGVTFSLVVTSNLTIESVGAVVLFKAEIAGVFPLAQSTLSEISTPITGWLSVTNPSAGITGQRREDDEALRVRRSRARDNDLLGALENLDGVTDARTVFNEGTVTDADGVPRQHLWAIVEGGNPIDIVETIAQFKAGGIGTFGSLNATGISPITGKNITYNYERPTYVEPDIEVEYTVTGDFPDNGAEQITQALVDYGSTLRIGESLRLSRLYTPVNTVQGMTVEITIDAGTADIVAGTDDKIRILASNITVSEAV